MLKKIGLCLVLILCGLFLAVPAFAAEPNDEVMPANLYTTQLLVSGDIDMVTGELSCTTQILVNEKCSFYITMNVYQLASGSWKKIETFRRPILGSYEGLIKGYTITRDVDKGYSYKVVSTAYVTSVADDISEIVTETSPILQYR